MLSHTARARPVLRCSPLLSRHQRKENGYKYGKKYGYEYGYKYGRSHVDSPTNSIHLPKRSRLGAQRTPFGTQCFVRGRITQVAYRGPRTKRPPRCTLVTYMCGIVGYIGPRKAVPIVLDGLRRLEYRGYDSAGIAVLDGDGRLAVRRASGKLRNLEETIRANPLDGSYGIGHTRWATHGGRRRRTRIRIATAPATSSWCTTGLSRTISR